MNQTNDSNLYPLATWRLITTPPAPGAWNMAVDEAILEAVGRADSQPVLRLYAWEPACLSLGFAQPVSDVDRLHLAGRGWDLVRRPTGGRAILHTDELTYSVIGPADDPRLAGSVLESYRRLAEALLAALYRLDVPAQARQDPSPAPDRNTPVNPVCFEMPSSYEIVVNGKKLIGSAQARRREGVLQHGSLPLYGELDRITQALSFPDEAARSRAAARLDQRATTVERVTGKRISWETAAEAFKAAFCRTLHLDLQISELTNGEKERATALAETKYGSASWTERV